MKIKYMILSAVGALGFLCSVACNAEKTVVIYTNADDEAIQDMQTALDGAGYKGQYVFQSFSTSELGGKLLVEGSNLEADMVTISSYYAEAAQRKKHMFKKIEFTVPSLIPFPDYMVPTTGQEGTIFYNTEVVKSTNLPVPQSLRDLANPIYKDQISIANIKSSSTAWLLVQGLVGRYGEEETSVLLKNMIVNAGPHFESSGSAPLKKVRAGEVAIGFGLRQQAVLDKKNGLTIEFIDPTEGNYVLHETLCIIDKKEKTNPKAMEMAKVVMDKARPLLLNHYPVPLYQGENIPPSDGKHQSKIFPAPLTVELLEKHIKLMIP